MKPWFRLGWMGLATALAAGAAERIVLVAGGPEEATDLPAERAKLYEPFGAEFDAAGNLWIVEMAKGNRLLKMDTTGRLIHAAGRREAGDGGDGGPGREA